MEDELEVPLDLSSLKRKPKKRIKDDIKDGDYTYTNLLQRVYYQIKKSGNTDNKKERLTIPPPHLARYGGKRTLWTNFSLITKKLCRQEEHLMAYMLAELSTNGSLTGNRSLNIYGRFRQPQIENILKKYIMIYIRCKNCQSHETFIKKDRQTRLSFLCCPCGAKINCPPIKR